MNPLSHHRHALRTVAATVTTAGLLAVGAAAATAHVTVSPQSTTENGYSQLTFSVPNESETAGTSKIEVELPKDAPFTSVRVKPLEGWKAEVITGKLPEPVTTEDGATITEAPTTVVWTAEKGSEISQQEYQTFSISVGKLPAAGTTVTLPAAQHYTDGSVREWDEPTAEGKEPESPAPAFVTTPEEGGTGHGSGHATTAAAEPADDAVPASATESSGSSAAGWAGLVAGLLGLAAGGTALARSRRTSSGS